MARKLTEKLAKARALLLDRFSHANVVAWQKFSDDETRLWVQLYHHLEALRQVHRDELRDALLASKTLVLNRKKLYRIIDWRYSHDPLSPQGSYLNGGRFNIGCDINPTLYPPFPALYLAEDHGTAYAEKFGAPEASSKTTFSGHEFALRQPSSFTSVRVAATVERVFDLTKASNLRKFSGVIGGFDVPQELKELSLSVRGHNRMLIQRPVDLKNQLLDTYWRYCPAQFEIPANSQIFGRLLRDAGFQGVWYPSAKGKGRNLALFFENLQATDSTVELLDPAPPNVAMTKWGRSN